MPLFVAVILLAYVPGKLLLIALKRALTPLEDVTLACVLGLVVSGLVYWLMTFANQGRFYFFWPLITAGIFVWRQSKQLEIALEKFFKHPAAFQRKRHPIARCVHTCFSRGPGAWNRRVGIFPRLLHQFYMATGWHDARLPDF